jgi:hypothetical protein
MKGSSSPFFRTDYSGIANNIVDWVKEVHPGIFCVESVLPTNSGCVMRSNPI